MYVHWYLHFVLVTKNSRAWVDNQATQHANIELLNVVEGPQCGRHEGVQASSQLGGQLAQLATSCRAAEPPSQALLLQTFR